ncbi:MAG: type II secretion system minor pseudopilin GspK [Gammaproteobacteria bacterium]
MRQGAINTPQRQHGVALITAILLVAMATIIAAKLSWDNNVGIRRTESTLMQEQARLFALGAEAVAIDVLRQDENKEYDHPGEIWAQITPPVEIGIEEISMGNMFGYMSDPTGRLNVNNLVPDQNEISREQFERLFDNLNVDAGIIDAIIDWIDPDTDPELRGAEDGVYTSLNPPYRPGNTYMTSISELLAINGIDANTFKKLRPHLTALHPDWCGSSSTGGSSVNINFASAEVISALNDEISPSLAQSWVEERGDGGWESLSELSNAPENIDEFATISTNCMELYVTVNIGSSVLSMYSLLDRSGNDEDIVTRVRVYGLD